MTSYLLKRLFSMVITLFLITVVIFFILSLSPIDPAQMAIRGGGGGENQAQQSAEEDIQGAIREMREHYNLDMPRLLNTDVQDRSKIIKKTLEALTMKVIDLNDEKQGKKLAEAKQNLKRMGSAAYKEVAEFLSKPPLASYENILIPLADTFYSQDEWSKRDFSKLSDPGLSKFMLLAEELDKLKKDTAAFAEISDKQMEKVSQKVEMTREAFVEWWKKNQTHFEAPKVKQWAEKLKSGSKKEITKAIKELTFLGKICAPHLIHYILNPEKSFPKDSKNAEELRIRAMDIMARLTNQSSYEKKATDQDKKDVLSTWQRWWERQDKYFVTLSGGQKFVRAFTHTQYGTWMNRLVHFNFGKSWEHKKPVIEVIIERIPISLQLALPAVLLVYLLAIPLGVFSATHKDHLADKTLTVLLFILYSLPTFWIGLIMIQTLTSGPLGFFPTGGMNSTGYEQMGWLGQIKDRLLHLAMPIFCMTYGGLAYISRQMRAAMLEVINQDYIRTAKAKGLWAGVVIWKHVFWNSTIPILTLLAGLLPVLMGGSVIIEVIFSIQGMGLASFGAVMSNDRPMIMAIMFCYAVLVLIGILLVDIAYAFVDPRITYD